MRADEVFRVARDEFVDAYELVSEAQQSATVDFGIFVENLKSQGVDTARAEAWKAGVDKMYVSLLSCIMTCRTNLDAVVEVLDSDAYPDDEMGEA